MEKAKISIVIMDTVGKQNLPAVLDCIGRQTHAPVEVLADDALGEALPDGEILRIPHEENGSSFIKRALEAAGGMFIQILDVPAFPEEGFLETMERTMMENRSGGFPVFVSVPLVHTDAPEDPAGAAFTEIPAQTAVFTEEYVHERMVSSVNQLDLIWANKLFYTEALKKKSTYFAGNLSRDLYRIYNASFYIKDPLHRLPTLLDNGLVKDRADSAAVRLRADSLAKRGLATAGTVREDFDKTTLRKSLHQWRLRKTREGYRFFTRKIAFPRQYRKYSGAPVDPRKVVFMEPRLAKLTNSMTVLRDRFAASEHYDVHEWFLRQDFSRHRAEYRKAMDFIRDAATARYIIVAEGTDVLGSLPVRPETFVLQTWHGCGAIKKCGYSTIDTGFGRDRKLQDRYPLYKNFDLVTVASPEHIWVLEDAMHLEGKGIVKPMGVSRSDVFYDPDFIAAARQRVEAAVPAVRDKKIILYCPTFRGEVGNAWVPDHFDIRRMGEAFSEEYVLLVKHHPLVKILPELPPEYKDSFAYDVTNTLNIEDLICVSDICISDYSSIFFEFSIFERPMLFFAPDRADYATDRGMYYDYETFVPGEIFDDTEGVIDYIRNLDQRFDRERVREFKEKYMSSCDGHATDRILAAMGVTDA